MPGRSVPQIIEILEMEGKAPPGLLKRTTLQDKLQAEGNSARQDTVRRAIRYDGLKGGEGDV